MPDRPPAHAITITDADDPRIAIFRTIRDRALIREEGIFIVEGENPVLRLLASAFETRSVLVSEQRLERIASWVPASVPLYVASASLLEQVPGFVFNRGVLACGVRRALPSLPALLDSLRPPATLLVCCGIGDAENLGQILRSASALGAAGVLFGGGTIDPFYRRVIRVSMGTLFSLPLAESADLETDLVLLKTHGFSLFATHLGTGSTPLERVQPAALNALLIGNESAGLPEALVRLASARVVIPMRNGVDSLNVAAAAAIVLYHFRV
ncbi:MAG TPA: RNA methyltransferase [bacterium]|nr:RNA methyltransferase [bacterium]HQG44707.1 RNA methyltransferase [bacterium]HQI47401.1 RNA methyltransferase [bacterium]HQJ63815.1 RNA methyltransferase [bacterium]